MPGPIAQDALTTVRLDILDPLDGERLHAFLRLHCVKFMVYLETSTVVGKEHFQGYVVCLDEYKSIKAEWVKEFGSSHTRYQRSWAPVRRCEEYMRYVAKDKALAFKQGYDDEHQVLCEKESFKKKTTNPIKDMVDRCVIHFRSVIMKHHDVDEVRDDMIKWIVMECAARFHAVDARWVSNKVFLVMARIQGKPDEYLLSQIRAIVHKKEYGY